MNRRKYLEGYARKVRTAVKNNQGSQLSYPRLAELTGLTISQITRALRNSTDQRDATILFSLNAKKPVFAEDTWSEVELPVHRDPYVPDDQLNQLLTYGLRLSEIKTITKRDEPFVQEYVDRHKLRRDWKRAKQYASVLRSGDIFAGHALEQLALRHDVNISTLSQYLHRVKLHDVWKDSRTRQIRPLRRLASAHLDAYYDQGWAVVMATKSVCARPSKLPASLLYQLFFTYKTQYEQDEPVDFGVIESSPSQIHIRNLFRRAGLEPEYNEHTELEIFEGSTLNHVDALFTQHLPSYPKHESLRNLISRLR